MVLFATLVIALSIPLLNSSGAEVTADTNEQSGIYENPLRESNLALLADTRTTENQYAKNPFLLHSYPSLTIVEGTQLLGYSLYDFPESREAVIDFISQFPTVKSMAVSYKNPFCVINPLRDTWNGANFQDVYGNEVSATEHGTALYFYLLDFENDGVPEIIMLYATSRDNDYQLNTVVYQYRDGEYKPVPAYLYSITYGIYFARNFTQPGEYSPLLPFAAIFSNSPTAEPQMFTSSYQFDIEGYWYVIFRDGAMYFEPMRVIRETEGLG